MGLGGAISAWAVVPLGNAAPTSVKSERSSRTTPTPISPNPRRDSIVVVLSDVVEAAAAPKRTTAVDPDEVDPVVIRL
jgi:hypothetical protein